MRKDEMTPDQVERRAMIVRALGSAGWKPTENHRIFESGQWFPFEASLQFKRDEMVLGCEYEAAKESLHLYIEDQSGLGVRLIVKPSDKLQTLLDVIVSFQNEVSLDNYRELIKKIVETCPTGTYLDLGEEGISLIENSG